MVFKILVAGKRELERFGGRTKSMSEAPSTNTISVSQQLEDLPETKKWWPFSDVSIHLSLLLPSHLIVLSFSLRK